MGSIWGKYRGMVIDNVDLMGLGRIRADVPGVLADVSGAWALPCVTYAGSGQHALVIPSIGAKVWIEFEAGDTRQPIWTGTFWEAADEVPPGGIVYAGSDQAEASLFLGSDEPALCRQSDGAIALKGPQGVSIVLADTGIVIDNGLGARILMQGPKVSVNEGALEIT